MMKDRSVFKYVVALLLFGSNGIVASHISLTSYEIVFTRTLIGSLLLILIFIASKQKMLALRNRQHFLYLVTSGIAMGVAFMCVFEAYVQVGVSIATLTYCCGPMIVMILSPILFKEKMTVVTLLGFLVVMAGMICICGRSLSHGTVSKGVAYGISAACMYALMVVCNKKAANITGLENPMWQLVASFITVAIFLGCKQGFLIHITSGNLLPIVVLGIFNTGIGCYFYFSSIGGLSVQTVAILSYLEPLSALFFSAFFLEEALSSLQWLGAILILAGAAVSELFQKKHVADLNLRQA
jgi:drug/metabolite transporter (DMT)-like permease